MNNISYENSIFEVLNVDSPGKVVLNFSKFKFNFFIIKNTDAFGAVINTKNGYIECTNNEGKFLYVYCGQEKIKISDKYFLNSFFYFIANVKFIALNEKIFSFKFTGGIINKIFPPFALDMEDNSKDKYVIQKKNNSIDIEIKMLQQMAKLVFYSSYHYERNIDKGLSISEDDSSLDILGNFEINDIFFIEYELSRIFSFMLYRHIENDYNLELMVYDENIKKYKTVANCYYKILGKDEICNVDKSFMNSITIYNLGKERFVKLFNIINDNSDDFGMNIDFIPEERKINIVNKCRIKETVSALECVLNKFKIRDKNADTIDFVKKLKFEIDANTNINIDDDIKGQLKNSLGYATYPVKQRIKDLYNKEMSILQYLKVIHERTKYDFSNIDEIIAETIDYRNNCTHNDISILNENVVKGIIVFTALIYSQILKKIGILDENISNTLLNCLK